MKITAEAIQAAHPLETKRHDLYNEAMELVGARHEKGDLVDLVNYLLYRNTILSEALRPVAERVVEMGMPRAKVDKDDLWVSIGFPQSVWLTAAKVLSK